MLHVARRWSPRVLDGLAVVGMACAAAVGTYAIWSPIVLEPAPVSGRTGSLASPGTTPAAPCCAPGTDGPHHHVHVAPREVAPREVAPRERMP